MSVLGSVLSPGGEPSLVGAPAGFSLPSVLSGLKVFKFGNDYSTNIRPIDLIDTSLITNIIFVDIATGNDANLGTSWTAAVKSIWRAIEIALTPVAGISSRIFIKSGSYPRENSFLKNDSSWDFKDISLTFEAKYGRVAVGMYSANTWSLEGGTTNVYSCTRSDAVFAMNPSLLKPSIGREKEGYTQYARKSSIIEVDAQPGSMWVNGTTVYIHAHGSVVVTDLNARVYENKKQISGTNYGDMYLRNIDTEGGRLGAVYSANFDKTSGRLVTDNTSHRYCLGGTFSAPITWSTFSISDLEIKAHFNTDASYTSADGFSISGSGVNQNGTLLVVNSVSNNNGLLTADSPIANKPSSVNGFTSHNGLAAVSVGGEYIGNTGAAIAIVHDDTTAWVLGAVAGDSQGDIINGKFITAAGASAADANCRLWLDSCTLAGCDRELSSSSGAEILLRNHTGSGHYSEVTGTIVSY